MVEEGGIDMNPMDRLSSLVTAIVASGIWFVVCFVVSIAVFRRSPGNIAVEASIVVFVIGFVIAFVRRNQSIGSMKNAEQKSKNASMGSGDAYRRGTQSISVLYIASFIPDIAIGAFRVFIGLDSDDVGFN